MLDGTAASRPAISPSRFSDFDDPAFARLYIQSESDGLARLELRLEGLHCAACIWLLERLPRVLAGVVEARVDIGKHLIDVRFRPDLIKPSAIARSLETLGYSPHPARDASARQVRAVEDRRLLIRIGVAGAIAGNVMTIAFALYGGYFSGMANEFEAMFRWLSAAGGVLSLAWPGAVFFQSSWAAIRARTVNLDLPITLGLLAGGVAGLVNTIRGSGEIYFDSTSALVFLLLVGRFLQHRQQRWASDALELLFCISSTTAQRVTAADRDASERLETVPIEALLAGDVVEVGAGATLPSDGVVIAGEADLDCAMLTGEAHPVRVAVGDLVHAGTTCLSASIRICVSAVGKATRAGQLMRLVEDATRRRPPIVRFADTVGRRFLWVVSGLAALAFVAWLAIEAARAADVAVAVLIVTCPCALGLAIPLIFAVTIGKAARSGILIKGGDVLEKLGKAGIIFLDKTGTLTQGRTEVVGMIAVSSTADEFCRMTAALEVHSAHPIARAICRRFGGESSDPVREIHQVTGAGMSGLVGGRRVLVGSSRFIRDHAIAVDSQTQLAESAFLRRALSPVLVAVDGTVRLILAVGDAIRPEAAATVNTLRATGWDVRLLSGDHVQIAITAGAAAGIPDDHCIGHASPEDKLAIIRAAAATGRRVVMVGDGVNDAAALAAATVGIAVHGGSEASSIAADVRLTKHGLMPLLELLRGSRRTMGAVYGALAASLAYNLISSSLAVTGLIHPMIAAILMPLSSFTVLMIAVNWPTFTPTAAASKIDGART